MARLIRDGYVKKARRWYHCDCCDLLEQSGCTLVELDITFSEKKIIVTALRTKDGKIKKGEPYYWQFCEEDGEVYTFRCIKAVYDILSRIGWFDCQN